MNKKNSVFLMSMGLTDEGFAKFESLVNKAPAQIKIAFIENAADIIPGSEEWLPGVRQTWMDRGYVGDVIDLREWLNENSIDLCNELMKYDVIWIGGGHTYYLRWILKASGADKIIIALVNAGKLYAGWSAGAVVAGPTIKHFDKMGDDPADAPEQIFTGLNLLKEIIVPHTDHPDFSEGALAAAEALKAEGYKVVALRDGEFFFTEA